MSIPDPALTLAAALALGAAYALVGAAVAVVALATRTLHLAVGPILVAGVLVRLVAGVVLPTPAAILLGLTVGATVSAALEPLVLGRLRDPRWWLVGLAIAAGVVETATTRWLAARTVRPEPLVDLGGLTVAGVSIEPAAVTAVLVGLPAAAVLSGMVLRTRWGRRLKLVGGSVDAAVLAGVAPAAVRSSALAVCGAAAVVAGLLIAPVAFVGVGQGADLTVRGVAAAVVLGVGGPLRAVAAGLGLGVVEAVGQALWPRAGGSVAVAVAVVVAMSWRGSEALRRWGRWW